VLILFNFEYFYSTTLSYKKVSLFHLLLQIRPENHLTIIEAIIYVAMVTIKFVDKREQ